MGHVRNVSRTRDRHSLGGRQRAWRTRAMRTVALICLLVAVPAAADSVVTAPVSFKVTNPLEPLVQGQRYFPGSEMKFKNSRPSSVSNASPRGL